MDGVRVFVVALLLCLATLGGVTATQTADQPVERMSVVTETNTAEYLSPAHDDINRTGQRTVSVDVAGAVGGGGGEARTAFVRSSIERDLGAADTDEERRAAVRNGTDRLSGRVDRLERRHVTAVSSYNDGEIGEAELLREFATLHREAAATAETLEWLQTSADRLGLDGASDRLASDRIRLLRLQGPVSEELAAATAGEGSDSRIRVHVDTSGDGVVLAAVAGTPTGPMYYREAVDPAAWTTGNDDHYDGSPTVAFERFEELYPWVTQNDHSISGTPLGPAPARVYTFRITHPHGELAAHLDGGSGDVYREVQEKHPERVPTTTDTARSGDLRIVANTTRAGGPLGITVVNASTGEPVDAHVDVNGDPLGSTEGDRLWTVAPRGETRVNATHDGENVTFVTHLR